MRFRLLLLALLFAAPWARAQTNLFANPGFESGLWSGSSFFADPNDATSLFNSSSTINGWTTNLGSTWVEQPNHTTERSRMVWLGPPSVGSVDCISQRVNLFSSGDAASQLVAGQQYRFSLDYAFYDPSDPTALLADESRLQIYYLLGSNTGGDNPFTQTYLLDTSDLVSAWLDGSDEPALRWNNADITFTAPSLVGYDYVKFFVSAPRDTVAQSSRGVLVDAAALSVVPEPSSALLLVVASAALTSRRRQKS